MKKVIVVGAGIGGLVTAGILARRGHKVTLFERSTIIGGRSHVVNMDGFSMSYGAHALIAPKSPSMKQIFDELGVQVTGSGPDNKRFFLYQNGELVPGLVGAGLLTSKALHGLRNRIAFLKQFVKLIRSKPVFHPELTVGTWIETNVQNPEVAAALRAYAALSTYDGGIDEVPMNDFLEHARVMYGTSVPLVYVDFQELLGKLEQSVTSRGGEIMYGQCVTRLLIRNGRACGVAVGEEIHEADAVVLNLPPKYLGQLSSDPIFQSDIQQTLNQAGTYAMVYDVLLDEQLRGDVKNVLDPKTLVYVNDMSLNCPSTTPTGMQMLNCLKFLSGPEHTEQELEHSQADVERVLDSVYPTWRDHLKQRRIIHRAIVQGISARVGARKLPVQSGVDQLFYVGDSTNCVGAFSLPAYTSALHAANLITVTNIAEVNDFGDASGRQTENIGSGAR